jgi:Protein of unknown function (DUF3054)
MVVPGAGSRTHEWARANRIGPVPSGAIDATWLLVFVLLGRTSHTEGLTVPGMLRTVWPFWVGLLAGWLVARAWERPAALVPTGVVVWPVTVAVAMGFRLVSGQGVAGAFIGVAVAFVGLGLLGWRALAALAPRRSTTGS